jgi:SAM-dependent methyltransferase
LLKHVKLWAKRTERRKRIALWGVRALQAFMGLGILRVPQFVGEWRRYVRLGGSAHVLDFYPCVGDKTSQTPLDFQYFYQAIWAFRRIMDERTLVHVDVGSSVPFVGMLTTLTNVEFVDIRPVHITLDRFTMKVGSITELPYRDQSVISLSCLHVIEHIGLGRYGDPIDPQGVERAAGELARVLAPGGRLYLSTPTGRPRVQFNGQRVFAPREVLDLFPDLTPRELSMVDADGTFREGLRLDELIISKSAGSDFGLGLFVFERRS